MSSRDTTSPGAATVAVAATGGLIFLGLAILVVVTLRRYNPEAE
ncbi:hypothetical protein ABZ260_11705 [Streptosporangium sp. NPDC006013]